MLRILIAETLEAVETGVFPDGDKTLACYFKCVMEKGGVVKGIFLQNVDVITIIKIGSPNFVLTSF